MKSIIPRLTTAIIALFTAFVTIPEANATKLRLSGSGYYNLDSRESYFKGGRPQSGRYDNLGAGYYHNAEIGMQRVVNRSNYRSGSMSFELWAMPYYGATSGPVLMTYGLDPLKAGFQYSNASAFGKAVSLNKRKYPEFELYEYTNKGWVWRDLLKFSSKTLL